MSPRHIRYILVSWRQRDKYIQSWSIDELDFELSIVRADVNDDDVGDGVYGQTSLKRTLAKQGHTLHFEVVRYARNLENVLSGKIVKMHNTSIGDLSI